jgi:Trk K+ transport system NAD-binding subunit
MVSAESTLLGKTVSAVDGDGARIMALVRKGSVMLPHTNSKVELGDELILVARPKATDGPEKAATLANPI